jgi:hypothetical protein
MPERFLKALERHGEDAGSGAAGPAALEQVHRNDPHEVDQREFAFATGLECSNPTVVDALGQRLRRDLLEECGHYERFREDLHLTRELGLDGLRYGLPIHRIFLGRIATTEASRPRRSPRRGSWG